MTRSEYLEKSKQTICNDRQDQYGEPEDSFGVIGTLWKSYKGVDFSAHDVAIMMALLKIARIATGQPKPDNYIDLAGYAACAGEISDRKNKLASPAVTFYDKHLNKVESPVSSGIWDGCKEIQVNHPNGTESFMGLCQKVTPKIARNRLEESK